MIRHCTVILVLMSMVIVAACNSGGGSSTSGGDATPAPKATATPKSADNGAQGSKVDASGKYDPPITMTTVRSTTPNVDRLPDQTLDDNVWTREYLSELGINLKNEWIVNSQQYPNKIMVTIVSGDLPDFFSVDMQQFQTLAQAGQLADLTEIFEEYASETVKNNLSESDGIKLKAGTVDGKLLGLALDGGSNDDAHLLYIRGDWLDNLGLKPPTTIDELVEVAIAFHTGDPDQNGINGDTYGLAVSNNLFGGMAAINGFLNAFGGYAFNPTNGSGTNLIFLKDDNGQAIWGDIQPEVKAGLGKLAELFEAGAIHPEFSVMDDGAVANLITSNKIGMSYGAFWFPTWPINNMKKDNPDVNWITVPAPSATGEPIVVQSTGMPSRFMVVSKDFEHPEAFIKVVNYTTDILNDPNVDMERYHTITKDDKNYQIHTLAPMLAGTAEKNQTLSYDVVKALKSNDPSILTEESLKYYEQVRAFEAGDYGQYAGYALWSENGVFANLGKYKQENRVKMTAYTGAPTPTMLARGPALRDLEVKAFMDIIMGAKPLDHFDEFVEQWLSQGGQDILDEINATGQVQ